MSEYKLSNGNIIIADKSFIDKHYPDAVKLPDTLPAIKRILTHKEFLDRLTSTEFKQIRSSAKNDPDVDMFMFLFERSQEINLDDPDTVEGVQMLEYKTLIGPGRASEILG